MALPAPGVSLAMSQINVELGRSATAQISLDTAENGGYGAINVNSRSRPNGANPAAISEWYRYNHTAVAPVTSQTVNWTHFRGGPTGGNMQIRKNGLIVVSTAAAPPINTVGSFEANPGDLILIRVFESLKTDDYCEISVFPQLTDWLYTNLEYNTILEYSFFIDAADGNYFIETRQDPFI
jgi:hypothetical protein